MTQLFIYLGIVTFGIVCGCILLVSAVILSDLAKGARREARLIRAKMLIHSLVSTLEDTGNIDFWAYRHAKQFLEGVNK